MLPRLKHLPFMSTILGMAVISHLIQPSSDGERCVEERGVGGIPLESNWL